MLIGRLRVELVITEEMHRMCNHHEEVGIGWDERLLSGFRYQESRGAKAKCVEILVSGSLYRIGTGSGWERRVGRKALHIIVGLKHTSETVLYL